jgi:hypothetical protein
MHIFLSYRRSDSQDVVGRIYDRLTARFGRERVFKDVDNIPLGVPFPDYLRKTLEGVQAMLVVIGPGWLTAATPGGSRRLDDPQDLVRLEVETGIALGKPLIPLLLSNTAMPSARDLPPTMQALISHNGLPVRPDPDFHLDLDRLIIRLAELLGEPPVPAEALGSKGFDRAGGPGGESLLHRLWESFDPDLQDALSLAYNQARREGKNRISTRTFFAALARLRPGELPEILDRLPEGALPEPLEAEAPRPGLILQENPLLSTCVQNTLLALGPKASPAKPLHPTDVFVDVAKYGRGSSVARLREHGVSEQKIDELVKRAGLDVVRREGGPRSACEASPGDEDDS